MNFEFFKQRIESQINIGDEIALYSDDEQIPSGRWKVASLGVYPDEAILVMLVGIGHI